MGTPQQILILDTTVLINFLAVDRASLFGQYPTTVLVTQHIVEEVRVDYAEQRERLNKALAVGHIAELQITDLDELQIFAELSSRNTSKKKRLGQGECSAIAVAANRGFRLGIDDRQAIKQVRELFPTVPVCETHEILLELIHLDALTVGEADWIKHTLSTEHRFHIKACESFADLMPAHHETTKNANRPRFR